MKRLQQAIAKFIFCFRVSADAVTFFKLIWFTKKYRWYKGKLHLKASAAHLVKCRISFNYQKFDMYLRTYAGDIDVFYEIFFYEVYQFNSPSGAKYIVDLGANAGLASLYFLSKYNDVNIIAVEPLPSNIAVLKKNLAAKIFQHRVRIVEAAIADKNDVLFFSDPLLKYNAKIVDKNMGNSAIEVKAITMNEIIIREKLAKIDLLKIDIEGAEINLFRGNDEWLTMVSQVLVEVHSDEAKEVCDKKLLSHGFKRIQRSNSLPPEIYYWSR